LRAQQEIVLFVGHSKARCDGWGRDNVFFLFLGVGYVGRWWLPRVRDDATGVDCGEETRR
jgi:hypothetical protein